MSYYMYFYQTLNKFQLCNAIIHKAKQCFSQTKISSLSNQF